MGTGLITSPRDRPTYAPLAGWPLSATMSPMIVTTPKVLNVVEGVRLELVASFAGSPVASWYSTRFARSTTRVVGVVACPSARRQQIPASRTAIATVFRFWSHCSLPSLITCFPPSAVDCFPRTRGRSGRLSALSLLSPCRWFRIIAASSGRKVEDLRPHQGMVVKVPPGLQDALAGVADHTFQHVADLVGPHIAQQAQPQWPSRH